VRFVWWCGAVESCAPHMTPEVPWCLKLKRYGRGDLVSRPPSDWHTLWTTPPTHIPAVAPHIAHLCVRVVYALMDL